MDTSGTQVAHARVRTTDLTLILDHLTASGYIPRTIGGMVALVVRKTAEHAEKQGTPRRTLADATERLATHFEKEVSIEVDLVGSISPEDVQSIIREMEILQHDEGSVYNPREE